MLRILLLHVQQVLRCLPQQFYRAQAMAVKRRGQEGGRGEGARYGRRAGRAAAVRGTGRGDAGHAAVDHSTDQVSSVDCGRCGAIQK